MKREIICKTEIAGSKTINDKNASKNVVLFEVRVIAIMTIYTNLIKDVSDSELISLFSSKRIDAVMAIPFQINATPKWKGLKSSLSAGFKTLYTALNIFKIRLHGCKRLSNAGAYCRE